jgi:hypothetical protein
VAFRAFGYQCSSGINVPGLTIVTLIIYRATYFSDLNIYYKIDSFNWISKQVFELFSIKI